jgi:hypothetical protein
VTGLRVVALDCDGVLADDTHLAVIARRTS